VPARAVRTRARPASVSAWRNPNIEPDLRGSDLPVVAIPADDDSGCFEPVEHLLDISGYAILELGDEIELPADEVKDSADRGGSLLGDASLAFGRRRVRAFQRELERAKQPAELAEPGLAEPEILLVDDLDFAVAHDRRLIHRFQIVLAV